MSDPRRVAVVGDILADVVVVPGGPRQHGSDTAATIDWQVGGAAANVAIALSGLGQATRLIGRVGPDLMGRALADRVRGDLLDPWLARSADHVTGTVVAIVRDGERDMLTDRGASAHLSPADLADGWLADVGHVHLSGYVLLSASSRPAGQATIAAARQAGLPLSIDPASAGPLRDLGATQFRQLLGPGAVLLTPNTEEARVLTGIAEPVAAAVSLAGGVGEVVITLGADGIVWSDGRRHLRLPAIPVDGAVNPVGAGDAFVAGLLRARMVGADVDQQLAAGVAAATSVVRDGRLSSAQ